VLLANNDDELLRLRAEARTLDQRLADLQPVANGSILGSPERAEYATLQRESDAAWQSVLAYVIALKGLSDDLRRPLPEDEE
jgi:hypothetical protein